MTSPDPNDLLGGWGGRLAAARIAAGKTQASLAAEAEVSVITIQRWEAGTRRPSVFDQSKLADLLGTPVSDLFPRNDRESVLEGIASEYDELLARTGNGCS